VATEGRREYYREYYKRKKEEYKKRYKLKKEEIKKYGKEYYQKNKETKINKSLENYYDNIEKKKEYMKEYSKKYRKENKDKVRADSRKYFYQKMNGRILGFTKEMEKIYNEAGRLELEDGIKREVHHIIPLNQYSDFICGLDVSWNLEILTKEQHLEKHRELSKVFTKKRSNKGKCQISKFLSNL
jgi:5-methylcytosine-specific restriction endonuclease McrA